MFSVFGKVKTYIIATLAISLPIIYLFGQIKGRAKEKTKVLTDELETRNEQYEFYKKMADEETDNLTDRKSITDRLRSNGL